MLALTVAGCGTFEIAAGEYDAPTPTEEIQDVETGDPEQPESDNTLPKAPTDNGLTEFRESLISALESRDFVTLSSLMGEKFIVGYWLSEGVTLTKDEAAEQLSLNFIPTTSSSPLTFTSSPAEMPDFGGADPALMFGPDVNVAGIIYSEGWGAAGDVKTVLIIAKDADGSLYWFGMLYNYISQDELLGRGGDMASSIAGTVTEVILQEPVTDIIAVIKIDSNGGDDQIFVTQETVIARMGDSILLTPEDIVPGMSIEANGRAGFWAVELTILQ